MSILIRLKNHSPTQYVPKMTEAMPKPGKAVRTLPARDSLGWLRHVDFFPSNTIIRTDWVVRVEQWSSGSGVVAVESNKPPNLFHWNYHIVLIQGRFITVQRINGYIKSLRVHRKIITGRISSLYTSLPFPSYAGGLLSPIITPQYILLFRPAKLPMKKLSQWRDDILIPYSVFTS